MVSDLQTHRNGLSNHPPLQSIFFGGGTPSLLVPGDVSRFVSAAQSAFALEESCEITLEANPNDILSADLKGWHSAGVNRLSIGVQSLDDTALKFLGRDHEASTALQAIELAMNIFPSVSIDLIYARPDQSLSRWESELSAALNLGAHHLSLYELTIEERTAFGKAAARGDLVPMQDDAQADLYEATQALTASAGYPAYEVSNHAISHQHQSRHNMIYWQSGDWIGIGPGAHGRLTIDGNRLATEAARRPADYIQSKAPRREILTTIDTQRETLVMGLRPACGVELGRLGTINQDALAALSDGGLVDVFGERLRVTPKGRLLTDAIAAQLSP